MKFRRNWRVIKRKRNLKLAVELKQTQGVNKRSFYWMLIKMFLVKVKVGSGYLQ